MGGEGRWRDLAPFKVTRALLVTFNARPALTLMRAGLDEGHSRTHAPLPSCMTPSINTIQAPLPGRNTNEPGINRAAWWRCRRPAATIMTTEFLRVKKLYHHQQEAESLSLSLRKRMELQPELSLAPAWPGFVTNAPAPAPVACRTSSSESDGTSRKKRKHYAAGAGWEQPPANLELQLNDPLPLDWEQCLDLQSGQMYYLNRKTLKKSWVRPREQSVNLDLNISTAAIVDNSSGVAAAPDEDAEPTKRPVTGAVMSSGGNNMVAVPCANCHLLVMLCKSSPSCPNCKFVQPLAPATPHQAVPAPPAHRRLHAAVKPLETLSLLH